MSKYPLMPQSPSSLTMFTDCPAKYFSKYHARTYIDTPSDALVEGNKFHKAMELAIKDDAPLPPEYEFMQEVIDTLHYFRSKGYIVTAEESLAINKMSAQVPFFDKGGVLRCKVDVLIRHPDKDHAVVIDWKTGKVSEAATQEAINAKVVRTVYNVSKVTTFFAFVKHDEFLEKHFEMFVASPESGKLDKDMYDIQQAHITGNFPAKTSGLCRAWCGNMQCEHNGKNK